MEFYHQILITSAVVIAFLLTLYVISFDLVDKKNSAEEEMKQPERKRPDIYDSGSVWRVPDGESARDFFDRCMLQGASVLAIESILANPPEHWDETEINHFTRLMVIRLLQWQRMPQPLG